MPAAGSLHAAQGDAAGSASGQNLDSYLTPTARSSSSKTMDDDAVRAAEAIAYVAAGQTAKAFERWGIVFGHQFPAYG